MSLSQGNQQKRGGAPDSEVETQDWGCNDAGNVGEKGRGKRKVEQGAVMDV